MLLIGTAFSSGLLSVGGILAWVWFVLGYTRRVGRSEKLGLVVLGGSVIVVATLNSGVGVLNAFGFISVPPQLGVNFHQFASIIEVLGTGTAIGAGIALLYATAREHRPFTTGALVGLSVPIVLLYFIRYIYQFGLTPGFGTIGEIRAGGLLLGLIGLSMAVWRYDLFEQLPASRTVGRRIAFDETDTAIIVVNNEGNLSDLNPAARQLFDTASDVVGTPLAEVLPATVNIEDFSQPRSVTFGFPNSDRIVRAETTRTTDDEKRSIGHTIVFNEITEERRRQQRIQVLNRVLRHNLRNDINAARGYIGMLTDGGEDAEQYEDLTKEILDSLVDVGNKARDIEQVLGADPLLDTSTPLIQIIEDAKGSLDTEDGDLPVTVDVSAGAMVWVNPVVLEAVLAEVIENAIEHGDASTVEISYDDERRTLVVADDGPGIPTYEVEVLNSAEETSLEHGSGLGLWLVKWGTDMFGGTLEFQTSESGTRIVITLPSDLVESGAGTAVGEEPEATSAEEVTATERT